MTVDIGPSGPEWRPSVLPQRFRTVLGHFVTGVVVVTAMTREEPVGFTCQSFTALSLEPPLILICAAKTSVTWPRVAEARQFCVNVLASGQRALCNQFARSGPGKFAGAAWHTGPVTGAPILDGVIGWLECELAEVYEAGDHWIAREQLNYQNPDVVAYVLAVRRQFMIRKYAAMRLHRRSTP